MNDTVLNWWTAGSTDEHLEAFFDFVSGEYEQAINCRIATITAAPKPSPQKSPSKSLKRSRVSDDPQPAKVESKMAKNARLRRAMEAVERTMGQMGNGDLGTGVFVCGLDTPHTYDQ